MNNIRYKTSPIRRKVNAWLDENLAENVLILRDWLRKQDIRISPAGWVVDSGTTNKMLKRAIDEVAAIQ